MVESDQERAARLGGVTLTYFTVVYSICVYDWLISLQKEYNRIWLAPLGAVKVIYFLARYSALTMLAICLGIFYKCVFDAVARTAAQQGYSNVTLEHCLTFVRMEPGLCMLITLSSELVLLVRCYSIWGRDGRILYGLIALMTAETAVMIVAILHFAPAPIPPGGKGPCIATGPAGGSVLVTLYWICPMITDTVISSLTFYKAWKLHQRGLRSQLFRTFVQTQGVYFGLIIAANGINTAFYLQPDASLQTVNSTMALAFTSILACRIVLALKDEEMNATNRALDVKSFTTLKKRPLEDTSKSGGIISGHRLGNVSQNTAPPVYPLNSLRKDSPDDHFEDDGVPYKGQPFRIGTRDPGQSYAGVTIDVEKAQEASYMENDHRPEHGNREF